MDVKNKTVTENINQTNNVEGIPKDDTKEREDAGYVKELFTDQQIYTSGVVYRYINNVDPNKDLITDTAKFDGPLKIETVPEYLK